MKRITIQIPQPCHERWADMQPAEQGRFCASCQKIVVDYTTLSDQELMSLLRKIPQNSCGRFRNEQLNRALTISGSNSFASWRHWVGFLTMGLFSWQTARAQVSQPKPTSVQQASIRPDYDVALISAKTSATPEPAWTVTGNVVRRDSGGNLNPVPNATVTIRRSGRGSLALTDSTGSFILAVPVTPEQTELAVWVYGPDHLQGNVTVQVAPAVRSVVLDTIILQEVAPIAITGGGIAIVQTPSRWQKLKRKLFR